MLGLVLTLLFAAAAVGTLNLVSVGFGVLFVGIAVDFAIQFCGPLPRSRCTNSATSAAAMRQTAASRGRADPGRGGGHRGRASWRSCRPTFRGVAELGLIAGAGMLIAFVCTLTFLPAAITLFRPPRREAARSASPGRCRSMRLVARWRRPILMVFARAGGARRWRCRRGLTFDSDPLDTKNPNTEAMRTLRDLIELAADQPVHASTSWRRTRRRRRRWRTSCGRCPPWPACSRSKASCPTTRAQKLAMIADAAAILAPTLTPPASRRAGDPRPDPHGGARPRSAQIEPALPKLPPDDPLRRDRRAICARIGMRRTRRCMAVNAALTRFLPQELDQLRTALSAEPVTLAAIPPDITRRMDAAGWARAGTGAAEAARPRQQPGADRVRAPGDGAWRPMRAARR